MRPIAHRLALVATPILLGATACLPYTVGSTAQTVPMGQTTSSTSYYFIPNAIKRPQDTVAAPLAGVDKEWRHGVDQRSDIGVRLTSGAGVVLNYKHRFSDQGNGTPALAYMLGTGIVNAGEHLHLEATLIGSGNEASAVMPFGGLRAMQVIPITQGAVRDSPTLGAFGGVQIGDASFTLRPEIGLFYDRSALGVRSGNFIVVPAITLQRGRQRSEARTVVPPAMQGSRRDTGARGTGEVLRCLLVRCKDTPPEGSPARPSVMVVH
jgi:hypothetical protein